MRLLPTILSASLSICLLSSCAALTKTQKEAVEEFGTAAKNYAELPKQVLTHYNQCYEKFGRLEAATTPEDQLIKKLNLVASYKFATDRFTNDLSASFQLVEKYSKVLLEFVNADFEKQFSENVVSLGNGIDSLIARSDNHKIKTIPIGFGGIASKLVKAIGLRRLKKKQLDDVQSFLQRGDVLINQVASVFDELVLNNLIKKRLEEVKTQSPTQYQKLLNLLQASSKTPADLIALNSTYLELQDCSEVGLAMLMRISAATKKFTAAHAELMKAVNKKGFAYLVRDVSSFTQEVNETYELIKKYK